ncbi:EamA-like transporter family protein [Sporotomaculum syntrophicum]|uniref:EamA-like transporter family protein n=1 Tax=Sporotomaculum syntrophicum TaxID=182264 RepID=A0A9D2WM50_9FIRM|nr:DMT family transporter [Sporotomaculum syntrophicum]KAF1083738.1 EamA-like transporter family protein [Sporotomaculum syntrophicum]
MINHTTPAIAMAILAAALYGVSSPVSKLLLVKIPPTLMAALLYLGAGIGMLIVNVFKQYSKNEQVEAKMTKKELPYIIGMILLDIAAPILLMLGLARTTAENVSLLNNFEIVATALIALFIFQEAIGRRMWLAIALITLSTIILTVEDLSSLSFSLGSLFVIAACLCWGVENNCTRMLSLKDPLQIVAVKGFGSGIGALLISLVLQEYNSNLWYIFLALILGFVAYGLSIFFYISAQRELGAARTSAYYAAAPFIGVIMSWLLLQEQISTSFLVALVIMLTGAYFAVSEDHRHTHFHLEITHEHKHNHHDGHHNHQHVPEVEGEHSHEHTHEPIKHKHAHTPDMHHRHAH